MGKDKMDGEIIFPLAKQSSAMYCSLINKGPQT